MLKDLYLFEMEPQISNLVRVLSKVLPKQQAIQECRYITQELPQSKWIQAVYRREKLEPLQYILGNQPFGQLDLKCKPGVLIPRIDTESWVMRLSEIIKENTSLSINLIDYCTGSGCVGLGMLSELKSQIKSFTALDISGDAVELVGENYQRNIDCFSQDSQVDIQISDLLKQELDLKFPLSPKQINLLVSNPPYIPLDHMNESNGVETSVLNYEPHLALVGDLEFYNSLCQIIMKNDMIDGFVFELGYMHQAERVRKLLGSRGWRIGFINDDNSRIRCVTGWKGEKVRFLEQMVNWN